MPENSSRTLVCSVVFLDIENYSKKPVGAQLELKQRLNELLFEALEHVAARDRIVLDTGDGAALTFLGDPEDALLVAMTLRNAALSERGADLALRMGVNLGPVKLIRDLNGQMNIVGDGINVAQRVMTFASAGQLLVSRSFYEVVSCLSNDYAELFRYLGARTDKHVREHEVYAVSTHGAAAQRLAETASRRAPPAAKRAPWRAGLTHPGAFGVQRRALLAAALVFVLFVGSGIVVRAARQPAAPAAPAAPVAASPAAPPSARPQAPESAHQAAAPQAPPAPVHAPAEHPRTESAAERSPRRSEAQGRATISLAIAPWGEVLVDGKVRGVSPPLRSVEVSPGMHTIEIRNSTFASYVEHIDARPGQQLRIRHLFR